jgi:phosphoserine phosphatase
VIASRLVFSDHTLRVALHDVGSQKVQSLEAAGIPIEHTIFYTDAASDLPVALKAARTVIVHPTKRSRRRLLAALSDAQLIE